MCLTGGDTSFDSLSEFNFFSDENLMVSATKYCYNNRMNCRLLRRALEFELLKQPWMADIQAAPQEDDGLAGELVDFEPFPNQGSFGWFEMFLRYCLDHVPATSQKWADIAATYVDVSKRRNFSNIVLRMLAQNPENDVRIDTFGWILRHNRENQDFLLEDLDAMGPVDLWIYFAAKVPNITLWKSILYQYKLIEQLTGNMFLTLYTQDAIQYYAEERIPSEIIISHMRGATKSFVLATYNFKAILEA